MVCEGSLFTVEDPVFVSDGLVFSSRWSYFKPEMDLLKPGIGPSGLGWAPSGSVMGPFSPGTGPLRPIFFVLFFSFFLVIRTLLKNGAPNPPSFLFWRWVTLGSLGAWPPKRKSCDSPWIAGYILLGVACMPNLSEIKKGRCYS